MTFKAWIESSMSCTHFNSLPSGLKKTLKRSYISMLFDLKYQIVNQHRKPSVNRSVNDMLISWKCQKYIISPERV